MKMLKKAAAVLLAAAMSLTMLTACGGGSSVVKTDEQKVEDAYMTVLNTVLGKEYQNDSGLQKKAKEALTKDVATDGSIDMKKVGGYFDTDNDGVLDSAYYIINDGEGKAVGVTSEQASQLNDPAFVSAAATEYSEMMKAMGLKADEITAVGTAAVKKGDKTYAAFAFTVDVSAIEKT